MMILKHSLLSLILVGFGCAGQVPLVVIGDNPSGETPLLRAAPSEVITLIVRGWNRSVRRSIVAPTENPTFELNGISAFVHFGEGDPVPLPILRIDPSGCTFGLLYVCDAHAITVLLPSTLPYTQSNGRIGARFMVSVTTDGLPGLRTEFEVVATKFRILNDCLWASYVVGPCTPQILHQDGESRVGLRSPAILGEQVSIRAIGLGRMDVFSVVARTLFREGSGALMDDVDAQPFIEVPVTHERQQYSGFYRINVKMPLQLPANVFPCSAEQPGWNVRVEVATTFPGGIPDNKRFVDVCVQP